MQFLITYKCIYTVFIHDGSGNMNLAAKVYWT